MAVCVRVCKLIVSIPYPSNSDVPSATTQKATDNLPVKVTSTVQGEPPVAITTEVPPTPHGDGEAAKPLVPAADGIHANGAKARVTPLIKEIKIEFEASSDQFGRITLYNLEILG